MYRVHTVFTRLLAAYREVMYELCSDICKCFADDAELCKAMHGYVPGMTNTQQGKSQEQRHVGHVSSWRRQPATSRAKGSTFETGVQRRLDVLRAYPRGVAKAMRQWQETVCLHHVR